MTDVTKAKKPTKKELFNTLLMLEEVKNDTELVAFLNHEIELLNKKSASASNKANAENDEGMNKVLAVLANSATPLTATQIMLADTSIGTSNQKVTAILRKLKASGKVVRGTDKKNSVYSIPPTAVEPPVEETAEDVEEVEITEENAD